MKEKVIFSRPFTATRFRQPTWRYDFFDYYFSIYRFFEKMQKSHRCDVQNIVILAKEVRRMLKNS